MDYLIVIYDPNSVATNPEVKEKLICNEKEMFEFIQENVVKKDVLFTVNKIECVLDLS